MHNKNCKPRSPKSDVVEKVENLDGSITYTKNINGKNVQVSNGVDSTKYVSAEPYGGRLYHKWVAPFKESKNPIRDLKKSIKKQAKIDG